MCISDQEFLNDNEDNTNSNSVVGQEVADLLEELYSNSNN